MKPFALLPSWLVIVSTISDSSGCSLLRNPWVAKWTILYCATNGLVAVSRLASKPFATIAMPEGAAEIIASASSEACNKRTGPRLPSKACTSRRLLCGERCTAVPATLGSVLSGCTRSSLALKTGSARTATILLAAPTLCFSRRIAASVASDGRVITSLVFTRSRGSSGSCGSICDA